MNKSKFLMSAVLVAVFILMSVAFVSAAAPYVTQGTAVVDGNDSEWTTSPTDSTNKDWFSVACNPNNCASTITGDFFARYDCTSQTLYVLGLVRSGDTYDPGSSNNWVAQDTISNKILYDGTPYTTNTSPPMWRDLSAGTDSGKGYEWALNFAPGTYSLYFHMETNGTATAGTGLVNVTLLCPTAVSLSSFQASPAQTSAPITSSMPLIAVLPVAALAILGAGLVLRKISKPA